MLATLTDCRLEDIECGKYQLVFASAANVLFWLNVCVFFFFFRKTVLPVFHFTCVDLLPAHFQKCTDAKLFRGFFPFQQLLQAGFFSLFFHPLPPPFTLTPSLTCNPSNKQSQGYNVSSH